MVEVYDDNTGWSYQVLDRHHLPLVNVSDIVSSGSSSNSIYSGKVNTRTGVYASTMTDLRLHKLAYNDTAITVISNRQPAGMDFYLSGLETRTFIDSQPSSSGSYRETYQGQVSNGVGEGVYNGTPMIIEGTFEYTVVLNLKD